MIKIIFLSFFIQTKWISFFFKNCAKIQITFFRVALAVKSDDDLDFSLSCTKFPEN